MGFRHGRKEEEIEGLQGLEVGWYGGVLVVEPAMVFGFWFFFLSDESTAMGCLNLCGFGFEIGGRWIRGRFEEK